MLMGAARGLLAIDTKLARSNWRAVIASCLLIIVHKQTRSCVDGLVSRLMEGGAEMLQVGFVYSRLASLKSKEFQFPE